MNPHLLAGLAILACLAIGAISMAVMLRLRLLDEAGCLLWACGMFLVAIAAEQIVQGLGQVVP